MIIAFSGHADIASKNKIKEMVKKEIKNHITPFEPITCYLGGYGDFDQICAHACKELKEEFPRIELIYVSPYMSLSEQEKIKWLQNNGFCDASIYPPIENTPPKFAISKRNQWMMENANLIIAYVKRNYGGAYQSLQLAKRKKKRIINICDLIDSHAESLI